MNCPCDEIVFPHKLAIPAGLSSLPRQFATFPEFRAAMLSLIGTEPALKDWRARSSDDFGIMLLEMWSYVCDCISFYDEVISCETYLRTAQLRPSMRKLVALLGYLPRPAVASKVDLAVLAEGRQPIALPLGTGFRSGGFPGGSPQVFELDAASRVHPFTNKWTLQRTRRAALESGPTFTSSRNTLLLEPKSVRLKADQLVLVEDLGDSANSLATTVKSIEDFSAEDGATYKELTLSQSIPIAGNTQIVNILLSTPGQTATIWTEQTWGLSAGLWEDANHGNVILDRLIRQIQVGDRIVLEKSGEFRWFQVFDITEPRLPLPSAGDTKITDSNGKVTTVSPPPTDVPLTWVTTDVPLNDSSRRPGWAKPWNEFDARYIKVHWDFRPAGKVTVPHDLTLKPGEPMKLEAPVEAPQDGKAPAQFLLEDKDSTGLDIAASVSFADRTLTPTVPLKQALVAPVAVYGNVLSASRGETVSGEVLGSGDASAANQTFKLKKSPLTCFPAPDGVTSTLKIYVDGLQWTEAPSFFGVPPDGHVFIVRQNDDNESLITFGDGIRGRRLSSGANNVIAYYRFGAGLSSPPAGSINQMAKPVKGITTVRNPVAASGGDDAETAGGLQVYAPRSALLLGRAISIPDMEAAAASASGVRAVRAEWRWNEMRQRPVAQLWYIGAPTVASAVISKLKGLTDSVTPFEVDQAVAVPGALSLSIQTDPKRIEADVLAEVRDALMGAGNGPLTPERIGIGLPLFRSMIFDTVLAVPGALAVTGLLWNGNAFSPFGLTAGAGKYFDLESGALLLNGIGAS